MQRIGPYEVLGELGRGGSGLVVRARDPRLGREVAIKLLLRPDSPHAWERFRREASALARLDHPGVVPVFEVGTHEGQPFLVTPLVTGTTLEARLRRGPLPIPDALRIAGAVARALGAAHGLGLLHRDVKPGNVLIDAAGEPRLIDFGLVQDAREEQRLSRTGVMLGTPGFWAPEEARGQREAIGPATDVYGLGATLYAALTGQAPQAGETLLEVAQFVEKGVLPPPPSHLRPGVPPAVDALVLRTLAFDPAARFASMGELERALGAALRPAGRARSLALPLLAGAVLLLGAGAAALLLGRGEEAPPTPAPAPAPPAPAPESDRATEAARLTSAAHAAFEAGDHPTVVRRCEEALALDPGSIQAWGLLASVRMAGGDLNGALEVFDRALQLEPASAGLHHDRGWLLLCAGRPAEAAVALERAIELDPGRAMFHLNLSLAREQLGDWEGSRAAASRAIELDPRNAIAWNNRGHASIWLDRWAEARADLDRALELDPTCALALTNRAAVSSCEGRFDEALADVELAIRLDPRAGKPHGQRGAALAALGRVEEALEAFDRSLAILPANEPYRESVLRWRERALRTLEARNR